MRRQDFGLKMSFCVETSCEGTASSIPLKRSRRRHGRRGNNPCICAGLLSGQCAASLPHVPYHPCIFGVKSGKQASGNRSVRQILAKIVAPLAATKTGSKLVNTGRFNVSLLD
jgi:hypothetical protein